MQTPSPLTQTHCHAQGCLTAHCAPLAESPSSAPASCLSCCAHSDQLCVFCQVSTAQAKLQYLRILNELPTFAGVLFNTVGLVW